MKKVFVEPRIKRIELNINENIANSGGPEPYYIVDGSGFVVNTGFTYQQAKDGIVTESQLGNCVIYLNNSKARTMRGYVSRKELFGY